MLAGAIVGSYCVAKLLFSCISSWLRKRKCKHFVQTLKRLQEADPKDVRELTEVMFKLVDSDFSDVPAPALLLLDKMVPDNSLNMQIVR